VSRRVCVLVTARPSYSRIKSALTGIANHPELKLQLVVGASALLERYGHAIESLEQDGFEIARRVYMVLEGENLVTSAKSTGLGLVELATVFDDLQPDVVVTVADRYETLATAVAASYMNIPVAHVQGGEVTGSIDEKVRHAVTKLSDIHFVATNRARERVIKLGEDPERVVCTGCPSIDLAAAVLAEEGVPFDPVHKYGGVGQHVDLSSGFLIVLQHPVTTEHTEARRQVDETLHAIHALDLPTLWFWPNVDAGSEGTSKGIRIFREKHADARLHVFRNMLPEDFLRLMLQCSCIVGNSSVAIREASFLGVPAVNIGTRQRGRERGSNVIDVDYDCDSIRRAIETHLARGRAERDTLYGDGHAGERIANHLATKKLCIDKQLTY